MQTLGPHPRPSDSDLPPNRFPRVTHALLEFQKHRLKLLCQAGACRTCTIPCQQSSTAVLTRGKPAGLGSDGGGESDLSQTETGAWRPGAQSGGPWIRGADSCCPPYGPDTSRYEGPATRLRAPVPLGPPPPAQPDAPSLGAPGRGERGGCEQLSGPPRRGLQRTRSCTRDSQP
ncbi:unnamed protein product [Nyctereutes procyonoides]|uniref:(raccoon dog) hypothetical protein n=1 Tax=Nyctereutes procyonoides TaxID=34880 RepID=A0A811YA05_NYCPR|nr:unnamed protein product [Nyctereutes procyonoides]